jgi:hypothetical protein
MPEKWTIHNFVTGEDITPPKYNPFPSEPTVAWVEGWEAGMGYQKGSVINPYAETSLEYHDWQDGFDAAERN